MHFVGIDLAWGDRNPTGLAVLDDDGAGWCSSTPSAPTTRSWRRWRRTSVPLLVAIDAPLVVTNPTGNRPAEAELNSDFARFDAGAHPSNTGKPEFSDGTRGARLSTRLKLDMNPKSGRARRAIEVYPHPATVALFRLGRTLKYKHKPGRDLDGLRAELLVLMDLARGSRRGDAGDAGRLARLVGAAERRRGGHPQVRAAGRRGPGRRRRGGVRRAVRRAGTRADDDLRRPGHGLHRHARPCRPTSSRPRAHRAPDGPTEDVTRAAITEYTATHAAVEDAASGWVDLVTAALDDAGINYLSVTGRAKSVASFAAKAAARRRRRPRLSRPAHAGHRPGRRPGDHLRAQRRGRRRRPAGRPGRRPRRPRHGSGDGERGAVGLRQPAPARRARRRARRPAGVRRAGHAPRPGADPHGAAARVGGVRARHPLQGHGPRRARARTSTAGSPWPPGCWSSPTASSPRSATGCRPA